ncbi:hypothetical protein MVEN_00070700 [Mycena venus]|uniref:Uncharacterized protein n=1 Tax=Mycena venus TaxID=2733690 RepID=A0A8H6Z6Z0_9AGAR|nr:hypothetical protein MVEN_00070700 [Mycena venus]
MPTTSDVIQNGKYLDQDFDPTSLNKPVLAGVLYFHNVAVPPACSKPKLLTLFNTHIKKKRDQLQKYHEAIQKVEPSSEGIIDGITGERVTSVKSNNLVDFEKPRQPVVTGISKCTSPSEQHQWRIQANASQRAYKCISCHVEVKERKSKSTGVWFAHSCVYKPISTNAVR